MFKRVCALAAAVAVTSALSASAQETCGGVYTVQRGDSLSQIADRLYNDARKWTIIFRANNDRISSADSIRVGQQYRMPCVEGLPRGLQGGTVVAANATQVAPAIVTTASAVDEARAGAERRARQRGNDKLRILVGDDYRPFTNRLLMSSGLITDLANRAMVSGEANADHEFVWINDRAAHLDPMLSGGMVDLALPWKRPDCERFGNTPVCTDYLYSEQMFEMLVVAFEAKARPITFRSIDDLAGRRVCSPRGHHTGSAGAGAGILTKVGARLMLPTTAEDCFARLVSGQADLVVMNEFSGRIVMKELDIENQVDIILRRPLSIDGLHAVVHRDNPNAQELIDTFNTGLERMRESGEYLAVIDRHMSSIWAGL